MTNKQKALYIAFSTIVIMVLGLFTFKFPRIPQTAFWVILAITLLDSILPLVKRIGVREKVFIVCLSSGVVPFVILTIALERQFEFIEKHSLNPLALEMAEPDVAHINQQLKLDLEHAIAATLGFEQGKVIVKNKTTAELKTSAASAGLLLTDLHLIPETLLTKRVDMDFRDGTSVSHVLETLGEQIGIDAIIADEHSLNQELRIMFSGVTPAKALQIIEKYAPIKVNVSDMSFMVEPFETGDSDNCPTGLWNSLENCFSDKSGYLSASDITNGAIIISLESCGHSSEKMNILLFIPGIEAAGNYVLMEFDHGRWLKSRLAELAANAESIDFMAVRQLGYDDLKDKRETTHRKVPADFEVSSQAWLFAANSEWKFTGLRELPEIVKGFEGYQITSRDDKGAEYVDFNWMLSVSGSAISSSTSVDKVGSLIASRLRRVYVLVGLAIFFIAVVSFGYSYHISSPITALNDAAKKICDTTSGQIRESELEEGFPELPPGDEIYELSQTLSLMTESLKGKINLANQQLLREKNKLETLIESTREGIMQVSSDGQILFANISVKQWFPAVSAGQQLYELLRTSTRSCKPDIPETWDAATKGWHMVCELSKPIQGETKTLSLYLISLRDSSEQNEIAGEEGYLAVCRDITLEKAVDQMKSEFVSLVSHELRTPLTSIKAYTEMILDGDASDQETQTEYLQVVYEETERLTRLINDLLDIARLESGKRVVLKKPFDLVQLINEVIALLSSQASSKDIKVAFVAPPDQAMVTADRDLIKQMAINLLDNSIKYSPKGKNVEIRLSNDSSGAWTWEFKDSGIGLTGEEKERLFTRFFRAESEFVRSAKGTGLGLTLVKQVVDSHSGKINVESTYGKGTSFIVSLPA